MSLFPRRAMLLLLLAALVSTVLLAVGLPQLRLTPGMALPKVTEGRVLLDGLGASSPEQVRVSRALLGILALAAGLFGLHALWRAVRGVRFATLALGALRALLVALVACVAVMVLLFAAGPREAEPVPLPPPPPPVVRTPLGEPPPLVVWLTTGGLLVGTALVAAWLLRPRPPSRRPLQQVALEAERARAALLAGDDAPGVILRCYAGMSEALAVERGIERPESTTPREFGELLGALGVPRPPVQDLTHLFEAVRYGGLEPGHGDVERALACLGAIVDHCRSAPREA